ncbi:hypothetical protein WNY37_16935 [Henriciella sp. AS95]|uniref:hypothetical protein n=1 Tax=Henriciella sp. AS95 TaxID=3135782 RepID=UPI00317C9DAF
MILQRLATSIRKQDWFTVLIETLIVVLGVFLGLQLGNWNQERGDREREVQIVADLLADLETARVEYANGLEFGLRRISAANASLTGAGLAPIEIEFDMSNTSLVEYETATEDAEGTSIGDPELIWTDVVMGYYPTPSSAAYDAIVGSGDINIIRDRNLVRQLMLYRARSLGVEAQNAKILPIRAEVMRIGMSYGLAPYGRVSKDEYLALIAGEPELAAAIRLQGAFSVFHYGDIKSADARAAELEASLEAYLEDRQ